MKIKTITDSKEIDIDKHALVEASAGTGKTFTIENLVARLVTEKGVGIDNILMVTFTEKATGELKCRIRERLLAELGNCKIDKIAEKRLRDALVNFDCASINTIHGFCQGVLRDYSFENSQLFDFEVAPDEPLYEKLLYEQMRRSWQSDIGDGLPAILEISGFPNVDRLKGSSKWIEGVIKVAQSYHYGLNHHILPHLPKDLPPGAFNQYLENILQNILILAGINDDNNHADSVLYRAYNDLNINKRSKVNRLEKVIVPILRFLGKFKSSCRFNADDFLEMHNSIEISDYKKNGFFCLMPDKWVDGVSNLDEKCPELVNIVTMLESIPRLLAVKSINQLGRDVERYKMKNGLISFNDMLIYVLRAIESDSGGRLVKKLRTKYKYAVIDEFQDTDTIQWKIFNNIFIKGEDQRLFLIGDPKQAIYSFRGADIFAYFDARREMVDLAKGNLAGLYSLSINWRSCPGLIMAFNQIFKQDAWFGDRENALNNTEISYQDANYPDCVSDDLVKESERAPFTIVNIVGQHTGTVAIREMARFAGSEIKRLVRDTRFKDIDDGGCGQRLNYGDICILVRKRSEVSIVERQFDAQGIPYSFYKKPGLYQSAEAMELFFLLKSIELPEDESSVRKGMLTPFFDISVADVHKYSSISPEHPVKILLSRWHQYALCQKWPTLFQSIIDESGVLTRLLTETGGERKLVNYRHIMENLENAADVRSLDFAGILTHLASLRLLDIEEEQEKDLHRIESERSKVSIMTIHNSKGLEFPVLFLCGGFTGMPSPSFYKYHNGAHVVYDLLKSVNGKELSRVEEELEDKRLYYVALTRAKFRLYLPSYRPVRRTSSGAVSAFIYDSIQSMDTSWTGVEREECLQFVDIQRDDNVYNENRRAEDKNITYIPENLFPPDNFYFEKRVVRCESFSSINRKWKDRSVSLTIPKQKADYPEAKEFESDDENIQLVERIESEDETTRIYDLPGGKSVGNMLHEILEEIDFEKIAKARVEGRSAGFLNENTDIAAIINERLDRYNIGRGHAGVTAEIIWNTLCVPLSIIDKELVLANISETDRIHELEFCYPAKCGENPVLPANINIIDGFYTGFIDLVFCFKGRYYFIDWKSNYIAEGYDPHSLEELMDRSNYHLQCRMYAKAMILWLKQCRGVKFDFERDFGGALYLFLRGMGKGDDGVYFCSPSELKSFIMN